MARTRLPLFAPAEPMGRFFEARKATMFARYDRMAKAFTRCSREIVIAVKSGGPDPDSNPALRRAIQNSRAVNMPKDKVAAAIKRALGSDSANYEERIFEGYAPNGIAVLIVTATDNTTRTVANLRVIFKKNGGNLGNEGSVNYLFNKVGVFRLKPEGLDPEELELELIDHGLEDMGEGETDEGEPLLIASCGFGEFGAMQAALEARSIEPVSSSIEYHPTTTTTLDEDQANEVLEVIGLLEGDDDVQTVFHTLA